MCKHVAAVLYGVGARLDHRPELLFRLRQVNEQDLIARAGADVPLSGKGPAVGKVLEDADLADVFGVELASAVPARTAAVEKPSGAGRSTATVGGKRAATGRRPLKRAPIALASAAPANPPAEAPTQLPAAPPPGTSTRARKRMGQPPSAITAPSPADTPAPGRRKKMSAATRKAVTDRMRLYWKARKQ
jgi:uncharacterized protein YciI